MKRRSVLFPVVLPFICACLAATSACAGLHSSEYLAAPDKRVSVHSAAVLPLENLTAKPDAGKAVADELATELAAKKLVVVDRGRAEAVLGKVDVIPGGTIDRIAAQRLGQVLGVDAVIFGSVAEATDGGEPLGPKKPSLGLSLRVLEVKTGNYLLAGTYSTSGDGAAREAAEAIGKAVGR